ncbi:hypothetical protein, partial [Enterococcus faecium]|uniref:hypothetical protein n=1 Tax=Enterococcus faecium TaxID=1352 RepID=UPI00215B7510
ITVMRLKINCWRVYVCPNEKEIDTMNQKTALRPITPAYDPWEAYLDVQDYGEMKLTNIEFTTTTL